MKMLSPVIGIVLFIIIFFSTTSRGNILHDLFNPGLDKSPQFSDSQLYALQGSKSVGLDSINGRIGCFGDFNSDKYTDLFVIQGNETETMVQVYLWNSDRWKFENSPALVISAYITNVAAGDFDYDGKLDLMVSGWNITNNTTYVNIYIGDLTTLHGPMKQQIQARSQVSVLDINNDLHLDLFGEIDVFDANSNTTKSQRVFWINKGDEKDPIVMFEMSLDPFGTAPLFHPHASAFVDLDGDCLSDRFIISTDVNGNPQYELLLNKKSEGFVYPPNLPTLGPVSLPPGSGPPTFADFDKDGNIDFLVPVCYPRPNCTEVNSIYIYFNKQKPMCSLLSRSSNCRRSTALCSADSQFTLGVSNAVPADPYFQIINITSGQFYFDDSVGRPLTIHTGDINLDGYPDILIPIIGETGPSRVELWLNVQPYDSQTGRRSFQIATDGVDQLTSIPNAYTAAFFDLDEDGTLDLFVLADDPPRIETLYNNFQFDAFFLKTLGLNGVCPEWCPSAPKFPSPKPYGVNSVGAVFKFTYTDLDGKNQLATDTQLPQSTYLALGTPYTLFGLGRTSNYIEQFFFGVPLNTTHFNYWTGSTIPNSQVVAIPYKPGTPAGWTLELYITPSGLLFWIMIGLVGSVIILSITVYIFYRREKKEDEQKKQEQAHLFSFDAL